jgi:hypothetical protein
MVSWSTSCTWNASALKGKKNVRRQEKECEEDVNERSMKGPASPFSFGEPKSRIKHKQPPTKGLQFKQKAHILRKRTRKKRRWTS